jgi:hypothetical protein
MLAGANGWEDATVAAILRRQSLVEGCGCDSLAQREAEEIVFGFGACDLGGAARRSAVQGGANNGIGQWSQTTLKGPFVADACRKKDR